MKLFTGWSFLQGGAVPRVELFPGWSCTQGGAVPRVELFQARGVPGCSCSRLKLSKGEAFLMVELFPVWSCSKGRAVPGKRCSRVELFQSGAVLG